MPNGDPQNDKTALHFEFVGMLFALAIAQVAIEAADLWTHPAVIGKFRAEDLPAYFHLLLATVVISASWVGWGSSASSQSSVNDVFSWDYGELLLDVFLVVCYFILVRTVESPNMSGTLTPSAASEVMWTMVILITYAFWDLWTKFGKWRLLFQRGWASFICAGLSVFAFFVLPTTSQNKQTVLLMDGSLLLLILQFRAMKCKGKVVSELGWLHLLWIGLAIVFFVLVYIAVKSGP